MQSDHCQDPNAIPLTQEEISNLVFKNKFGIVKILGMRPSSSLITTASSNSSVEYIQRLENEIIELNEARARDQEEQAKDQEERDRDQEARAKQEEVQKNILNFLRCKVVIYNYVLCWLYSMTKSVVIALILFLVFCGILLY